MYRLVVLFALAASSFAQYVHNAQNAAILSEQRYLSGDGTFGAAYSQEDGVEFKEESDGEGNRRGSYSYVDPNGQRRTISYTAGKDGFRATGDHLPVPPPAPAQPLPVAPQPQYQPLPQYNPPPTQQYQAQPQYNPPQPQYNPPQPQYNPPQSQYNPQTYYNPPQPQYNAIPHYSTTTPPPHRFFPPGKLNLNRTPDGFSYTFNKS
ncbi:pupal cuticle protein Edg-78E [Anabrus simplex]|uniref:pupal cuticle protein Edg-78E n=1 Tax=Anabrus simplex TaxID=316456 RepID=UPI0034DD9DE4